MRAELRRALERVLLEPEIWREPARLRAFLVDLCPERAVYTRVLCVAAEQGVVAALARLRMPGAPPLEVPALRTMVGKLCDKTGLSDGWAEWGIRAWSEAMGLSVVAAKRPPAGLPPVPASPHRETPGPALLPAPKLALPVNLPPAAHRPAGRRRHRILALALAGLCALGVAVLTRLAVPQEQGAPNTPVIQQGFDLVPRPVFPPDGWGDPVRRKHLLTTFVGERALASGRMQTLVLRISAFSRVSEQGGSKSARFSYVLNEGGRRSDNTGTLSFVDGRVELPDLGAGRLGLDRAGRPWMVADSMASVLRPVWQMRAQP